MGGEVGKIYFFYGFTTNIKITLYRYQVTHLLVKADSEIRVLTNKTQCAF